MKLLFDENIPRKLRYRFAPTHEVVSVQDLGWRGKENGELLGLMLEAGLQAIITGDKNMPYQQNWQQYPFTVLVLAAHPKRYDIHVEMMPQVLALLAQPALAGGVHVIRLEV